MVQRGGEQFDVGLHHFLDQAGKIHGGFPAEHFAGFAVISNQQIHLGGTVDRLILPDVVSVIQVDLAKSQFAEFADTVRFAR